MDASNSRNPLEIPELLEQVFLHLTQSEILQAQRVSCFWRDTISESPLLQQELFFQPLPPSKAAERAPKFNPIAKALFPFLFELHAFPNAWLMKLEAETTIQHWAANPDRRRAVFRPDASWRRMLPVQPAAPIDGFVTSEWTDFGDDVLEWGEVDPSRHDSTVASRSASGNNATMGLLYDIVLHHYSSNGMAAICVQWNMFKLTRELCHKSPKRVGGILWQLDIEDHDEGAEFWAEYDKKVEPRNTITIHAEAGPDVEGISPAVVILSSLSTAPRTEHSHFEDILQAITPKPSMGDTPGPTNPTDLRTIVDLPAGVVRTGNKANQYSEGNDLHEYMYWGKLQPGLESVLEQELRESADGAEDGVVASN